MPYTVDFLEDDGVVVIENIGMPTYQDSVKQSAEALELGRVKNARLFLSDCTCLAGQVRTPEVFDFPKMCKRSGAPKTNSRVAALMSEDAATNRDIGFYDAVCRSRGWPIRTFSVEDAALERLLSAAQQWLEPTWAITRRERCWSWTSNA